MAISPPSDLVLDVVRAADPTEVQEAQARLKANQAAFRATSLAENGNGFANTVAVLNQNEGSSGLGNINNRAEPVKIPETYRKFEAMVLQNFVKSMLPTDSEEVYGKGTAGNMWKSMMAEQVANVMAEGDGVGIAKSMITDRIVGEDGPDRVNASLDGNDNNVALSMVQEYQRKAVDQFMGTEEKKDQP
ncbi:Rod binding domain-containing protein [Pararhizobium capsulatum DSM 1112]|uniref:Rod binding domain-containing protein n=1 Tax=Pararhizobium capsulatum DSM 1112 TaxID=1121113 RepID=A0ABU0BN71_9HYPH|nr:rod-binding protein [Pararhizobium capsulatum]MDQ0319179.1 Rod binding domain-containing protein [Pararhizobium capsulatum DSM 1112]